MPFSRIAIIYNPNSTGNSRELAQQLADRLRSGGVSGVELTPTKRAGHAEQLARDFALKGQGLVVSSSGDGGYHEVINGIMQAAEAGYPAVAAVLPAGNANDHRRTVAQAPLHEGILAHRVTQLDLLRAVITTASGAKTVRYAHSYIGLGLTPVVATELNRHSLNALREAWIVLRTFWRHRPFKIRSGGTEMALDSLIFSNIRQMAKALTLSETGRPDDGVFEVTAFPAGRKLALLGTLLRAAALGLRADERTSRYDFEVIKAMPIQLDGEVTELEAGTMVSIQIAPQALRTVR